MVSQEDIERLRELLARPVQNIVLLAHTNPDGDAVGSLLAWREALVEMGHRVTCIVPNKYPYFLDWMTGVENLVLFKTDEAGVARRAVAESDLIFFLDFNAVSRLEGLSEVVESNTTARRILIDHHLSPGPGFDLMFSCTGSSSTAFLIYQILEKLLGTQAITRSMAESLYVGMMTDTGNFSFSFLTPELYRAVAVLVETGIDIPNVNTLIIEDADRLGLAQLHQIRGRIGRSARRAYAYMTYRAGKILTEVAAKRLTAIREYAEFGSGFRIAMRDLEIRGAGNLLGPEQSGYMMSVGYDMYLQLLEEAVLEQRGEKAPQRTECSADLTVSANLPESYIPSGEQRMDIYRRIAALRTAEQSQELLDELIDRYGEPPQPVLKLMDVALLRAEAVQIGVSDISQRGSEITFTFAASEAVPGEAVMALCSLPKNRRRLTLSATGTEPKLLLRLTPNEDALDTALTLVGDLRVNKEENEKEVTL